MIETLKKDSNFSFFTELLKAKIRGSVITSVPREISDDFKDYFREEISFRCNRCQRKIHIEYKNNYYTCDCGNNIELSEVNKDNLYILKDFIFDYIEDFLKRECTYNDIKYRIIFGEIEKGKLDHKGIIFIHITPFKLWGDYQNGIKILDKKYADNFSVKWSLFPSLFNQTERKEIFEDVFNSREKHLNNKLLQSDYFSKDDTISILHISDFHFKGKKLDNKREYIIRNLIEDVKKYFDKYSIQKILISGDLAFSGKRKEYNNVSEMLISELIDQLNISTENIFVVPGNHDLDRDFFIEDVFEKLTSEYDEDLITDFWYSQSNCEDKEKSFLKFKEFKNFQQNKLHQEPINVDKPYITDYLELNNYSIGILGLNSAWLCGCNKDDGKIFLCEFQIIDALSEDYSPEDYDFNIAIFHHPLDSFNIKDREKIKPKLFNNFDLILFGHTHDTRYIFDNNFQTETRLVRAGSSYGESDRIRGLYNVIQFDIENKKARIVFRKPVKANPDIYYFDSEISSRMEHIRENGVIKFDLS